jgi:uncharacterized membrane protein
MVEMLGIVRLIHEFAGMTWYGEVFFITFILAPVLGRLPSDSNGPLMVKIFPRIFRAATVTASVTIVAGALTALLYANFDFSAFLDGTWGLSILAGGLMGLFMYLLHMTVEAVEIRGLKGLTLEEAKGFPEELTILEKRALMLPGVGFVILTTVLLLMVYAAHGL